MSMDDLERALVLVAEHPDKADFVGPRSETLVRKAEDALGLRFSPTYRRFVSELGAGSFGADEFYGVIKDDFLNSSVPDAVWVTLHRRSQGSAPSGLVFVYGVGEGTMLVLDARGGELEHPVVEWGIFSQPGDSLSAAAPDFGRFFLETVQRALGVEEDDDA